MTESTHGNETTLAPLIQVNSIHKTFRQGKRIVQALKGVSFAVERGESLGIIGESGSGKSTLIRIMLGLETQDSGTVTYQGEPRKERGFSRSERLKRARQMQIVFQDPSVSLDPRESLYQALDRILQLHSERNSPGRKRRIAELADAVGLSSRQIHALPKELSGGQKQRMAIARALSVEPEVLVLDEAVSALDVSVQAQILNLLNDLRSELGLTYLFVSHDLSVVRYVSNRSIVMRNGMLMEEGVTGELLSAPKSLYTRLLLASVPGPDWNPDNARKLREELEQADNARV